MPDYDPKSIPILDDIIEDENKAAAESDAEDVISEPAGTDDKTADLFNGQTADIEVDVTAADIETGNTEVSDSEESSAESALIGYPLEVDTEDAIPPDEEVPEITAIAEEETEPQLNISEQPDNPTPPSAPASSPSLHLESIVDEVVTQLMPDLEQQLRLLVRQALEQKLPEEIASQIIFDQDK